MSLGFSYRFVYLDNRYQLQYLVTFVYILVYLLINGSSYGSYVFQCPFYHLCLLCVI